MRRDQLEHAIRAACQITGQDEVIVVGSQAILGTYPEYELPMLATRSLEVDILPITDDNNETIRLADLIVGVAGEFSPFEQQHGFSIDGVDLTTSALHHRDLQAPDSEIRQSWRLGCRDRLGAKAVGWTARVGDTRGRDSYV